MLISYSKCDETDTYVYPYVIYFDVEKFTFYNRHREDTCRHIWVNDNDGCEMFRLFDECHASEWRLCKHKL